jgi:thioredoxin 1
MDVIQGDDSGTPEQGERTVADRSQQPCSVGFWAENLLYSPVVKRILLAGLCFAAAVGTRADVVELQDGTKTECHVLSLFNQRLEIADKDGSVTHVDFQQVKRIDFDSKTAAITTRNHLISSGKLLGLEDGMFTLASPHSAKQLIAATEVTDITVSDEKYIEPPPPPPRPKPAAFASASRSPASGSIQPERGKITIVDFYADWCGPCRKIGPVLEKIAEENSDVVLQKVNIDKHKDLAQEYNVTGIPHIIIYDKSADVVDTVIGCDEPRVRKAIADAGNSF